MPAGKSIAIQVEVSPIDDLWKKPFSDYEEAATEALERVVEFIEAVKASGGVA